MFLLILVFYNFCFLIYIGSSDVSVLLWPSFFISIVMFSRYGRVLIAEFFVSGFFDFSFLIFLAYSVYCVVNFSHAPAVALAGFFYFSYYLSFCSSRRYFSLFALSSIFLVHVGLGARVAIVTDFVLVFVFIVFYRKGFSYLGFFLFLFFLFFIYFLFGEYIFELDAIKKTLGGDAGLSFMGVGLNTSGRSFVWPMVLESALERPLFGHGVPLPEWLSQKYQGWEHPHNDYLRLFHQTGMVGLSLWCLFSFLVLILLYRKIRSRCYRLNSTRWMVAGSLSFIGLLVSMFTDNPLAYSYVLLPCGLMIGMGMSQASQRCYVS
ncbi:O-antigen ligase family protein [Methylophaga sp.]|uniref:O-antigen ligase family protein n=1 Tax=Methylophaga sp. TaxID=2024840 RepID=UPI003A939108